jgi:CRISPR/Cas system CSM-associated protein Csm3 (group 7 of RAMP superfamily)
MPTRRHSDYVNMPSSSLSGTVRVSCSVLSRRLHRTAAPSNETLVITER